LSNQYTNYKIPEVARTPTETTQKRRIQHCAAWQGFIVARWFIHEPRTQAQIDVSPGGHECAARQFLGRNPEIHEK